MSENGPNRLIPIFGLLFSIFIGCFGGLGYTASESYLDLCAEMMPIALVETSYPMLDLYIYNGFHYLNSLDKFYYRLTINLSSQLHSIQFNSSLVLL